MEHAHHYTMMYNLIMQMAASGVLENAVGNAGKARLAKMGRTFGIPILVMCRYANFSAASVHIMDAMAKDAGIETLSEFIQKTQVSAFDADETNINTFSQPL